MTSKTPFRIMSRTRKAQYGITSSVNINTIVAVGTAEHNVNLINDPQKCFSEMKANMGNCDYTVYFNDDALFQRFCTQFAPPPTSPT